MPDIDSARDRSLLFCAGYASVRGGQEAPNAPYGALPSHMLTP